MIEDTTQITDEFGFNELELQPHYSSESENENNLNDLNELNDKNYDTCADCENKFKRIGGGIYVGVLSYCNDCSAKKVDVVVDKNVVLVVM